MTSRNSLPGWVTISSWSLGLNLLIVLLLALLDSGLGLFLSGPMMILAAFTGLGGLVMSKDSYNAGRTRGAIFGVLLNIGLVLWPLQSFVAWALSR